MDKQKIIKMLQEGLNEAERKGVEVAIEHGEPYRDTARYAILKSYISDILFVCAQEAPYITDEDIEDMYQESLKKEVPDNPVPQGR